MAKKNYDELAKQIVTLVGGVGNINSLTHCVTRLRFQLKDNAKADEAALKALTGVLTVVVGNGQYQVVIGNAVGDVFDTILRLFPIQSGKSDEGSGEGEKTGNPLTRALNKMAAIINPVVPALAGAGMIKALLVILSTTLGVLDNTSSTYLILTAASNSVFYFLPLFLAFSSANAFQCNPFVSLAIVAALMEPNFTGLMTQAGDISSFLGIPVYLMSYSGTLIPPIVAVLAYSKLEKFLKKFIPKSIELFALPMVSLLIMVPLTMIVIGPIGVILADTVANIVNFMAMRTGVIAGLVVGAGWTLLVMVGIHWGVVPIMVSNISTYGYDLIRPMVACATFASSGAAFGTFLKSKNKETKAFAVSTMVPALLGGVTEPVVYGISLRYKKPLIAQIIGGGIAGAFMGAMHVKAIVYVFPALTTLPAFFGETFVFYMIGIAIAFFVTAALTYIFGIPEEVPAAVSTSGAVPGKVIQSGSSASDREVVLTSCLKGTVVPLDQVKDEVFASKTLGEGIGIIPEEGVLYAPADGVISNLSETFHAIGLDTPDGMPILMHIGIDTVALNGKGFKPCVKENQSVRRGDKLIEFDISLIQKAGYDTTTMLLVTDMDEVDEISFTDKTSIQAGDNVITYRRK